MLERAINIPALDEAYQGNIPRCHQEILKLTKGDVIRLGKDIPGCDILLETVDPLDEELDIINKSIVNRREYSLVMVGDNSRIIRGNEHSTDPDSVHLALDTLGARNGGGLFSHTHWNTELNPLPSMGGIGLGDVAFWRVFRGTFPELECRIVTNSDGQIRAFRYLGDTAELK